MSRLRARLESGVWRTVPPDVLHEPRAIAGDAPRWSHGFEPCRGMNGLGVFAGEEWADWHGVPYLTSKPDGWRKLNSLALFTNGRLFGCMTGPESEYALMDKPVPIEGKLVPGFLILPPTSWLTFEGSPKQAKANMPEAIELANEGWWQYGAWMETLGCYHPSVRLLFNGLANEAREVKGFGSFTKPRTLLDREFLLKTKALPPDGLRWLGKRPEFTRFPKILQALCLAADF